MRIKKKYVLLEALLIDVTKDLTPYQKKILKILHKKYPIEGYFSESWEASIFLIEELELDYQDAYDMVRTYSTYGEKLFKETENVYRKASVAHVFFMNLGDAIKSYIKNNPYGKEIEANFKWDTDPKEETSEGEIWDNYKGFTLYLPFYPDSSVFGVRSKERGMMVSVRLEDLTDKGNEDEFKVIVIIGRTSVNSDNVEEKREKVFDEFLVKYPERVTKKSFYDIIEELVNNTVMDISSVTHEEKGWWY